MKAIQDAPKPKNVTELFRIANLSLYTLLKKSTTWNLSTTLAPLYTQSTTWNWSTDAFQKSISSVRPNTADCVSM